MADRIRQADLPALVPGLHWPDDQWTVPTLRDCLGRRLAGVAHNQFWHRGRASEPPRGELEFAFAGGPVMTLSITHIHGVVVYPHPLVEQGLDEYQMEWRRRPLDADGGPWAGLVGGRLTRVGALVRADIGYGYEAGVVGLVLTFSPGGRVGYENWSEDTGWFCVGPAGGVWEVGRVLDWMEWEGGGAG